MAQPTQPIAGAQDPWAGGFAPGLAAVPTSGGWSTPPDKPRPLGSGARYLLTVLAVIIFGGGAGLGSWYLTGQALGPATVTPTPSAGSSAPALLASCPQTQASGQWDPCALVAGDCFVNLGTATATDLKKVTCDTPNRYRVETIITEAQLGPTGVDGLSDAQLDALRDKYCAAGYSRYSYDYPAAGGDRFMCLSRS